MWTWILFNVILPLVGVPILITIFWHRGENFNQRVRVDIINGSQLSYFSMVTLLILAGELASLAQKQQLPKTNPFISGLIILGGFWILLCLINYVIQSQLNQITVYSAEQCAKISTICWVVAVLIVLIIRFNLNLF